MGTEEGAKVISNFRGPEGNPDHINRENEQVQRSEARSKKSGAWEGEEKGNIGEEGPNWDVKNQARDLG